VDGFEALDVHLSPDAEVCGMKSRHPLLNPYVLLFVPGLNVFFEIFRSSKPPSPEALKDVLNMIILVATLLFAVTVTIPFGFAHEELIAYTNLWREGGMYEGLALESRANGYEFTEKDYALPVIELVGESVLTINFLFSALVISIIMYVSLSSASFRDADDKINVKMLAAWWSIARFGFALALGLLVYGIWCSWGRSAQRGAC
jgi:hypothetical protein